MSNPREEWINNRAYALWEQDGREHGRDSEHWKQAAREWEELERVALPGHIHGGPPELGPDSPSTVGASGITNDDGIPPDYLQSDSQESPVPRLGPAPSVKKQTRTGSEIVDKSEEKKAKGKTGSRARPAVGKDFRPH